MNLYEPKHLADSMRVVRKNTIAIAEDIPEAQYDYRPTQDSRSVRETLLHMASMTLFDLHIHEEQRRTSMEGFDFREFFAGLPTNEKCSLPKAEILAVLRDEVAPDSWLGATSLVQRDELARVLPTTHMEAAQMFGGLAIG